MIRSKIWIACCLLLFSTVLVAQDDDKPSLLTITAGWSFADYTIDGDGLGSDPRNGFFVGARKDVKIVPMLHFNTGLLYTQQGTTLSFDGFDDETEIKTSYIDIPVGLKFKIGPVFATGGISGNIKVGDNFDDFTGGGDGASELKGFDWAYSFGLGAKIAIFSLDLRWNNSFGDIIKDNETDVELKNSYFLVGLGVSLNRK